MKYLRLIFTCPLVVILAACGMPFQSQEFAPASETLASPAQLATVAPAPTELPLYQQVRLVTTVSSQTGKAPDYTFKTQVPVMEGSSDPRVEQFNKGVTELVQRAVDQFRNDMSMQSAIPISAGSYFDLSYALVSPPGHIFSLRFQIEGMVDGAAHPYHITFSYNFDLGAGKEIRLDQLFLNSVDPLPAIAKYCGQELGKRDIGFEMFTAGADPSVENYSVWNISVDGLVVIFNEYQVTAYAAGAQTVVIPFDVLKDIIDPNGPLADIKP
ncbi:MAG: RsiV family protein [Chloroflexi bacterium]|nr:RsiV family protein [Chloroflexota bacterium]